MSSPKRGFSVFCAAVALLVANASLHAQTPAVPDSLEAAPTQSVFGNVQYGATVTLQTALTNTGHEDRVQITKLEFSGQDAAIFSLASAPQLPLRVDATKSVNIPVSFAPAAIGHFVAKLDVTYVVRSVTKTVSVDLLGNGACVDTAVKCDPPAPLCRVAEEQPHELWVVPNYTNIVSPYIAEHFTIHKFRPDRSYDMPISTFWNVLGLANYFPDPNPNPSCDCDYRIHFERDLSAVRRAVFTRSGSPISLTSLPIPGAPNSSIELDFPATMSGVAYVFPGTSEFHFSSGRPHLKVIWQGQEIFNDDLTCSNSSTAYASIRRLNPSSSRPGLDMLFRGQ